MSDHSHSTTPTTCITKSSPDLPFVQPYQPQDKLEVFYPMLPSDFYASKIIFHFPFFGFVPLSETKLKLSCAGSF